MFFDGFTLTEVDVPGGHVRLRHGGSGPPLLLLHGNPQSHCMWNRVAPALAKRFTVVCPDLRGYCDVTREADIEAAITRPTRKRDMGPRHRPDVINNAGQRRRSEPGRAR